MIISQFEPLLSQKLETSNLPKAVYTSTVPTRIKVQGTSIDLPIKPAKVSGNDYQFFSQEASFLEISSAPGEGGNIVIYAHNEPGLFEELKDTSLGQEIILETDEDQFRYIIFEKRIVEPTELEALQPTYEERLTLITCFGENRSHRLIIFAMPIFSTPGVD